MYVDCLSNKNENNLFTTPSCVFRVAYRASKVWFQRDSGIRTAYQNCQTIRWKKTTNSRQATDSPKSLACRSSQFTKKVSSSGHTSFFFYSYEPCQLIKVWFVAQNQCKKFQRSAALVYLFHPRKSAVNVTLKKAKHHRHKCGCGDVLPAQLCPMISRVCTRKSPMRFPKRTRRKRTLVRSLSKVNTVGWYNSELCCTLFKSQK